MGLSFPPEARILLYHRASENTRGLPTPDDAVHLKVELPASSLSGFLAQAPLASAAWSATDKLVYDVPSWTAWQPSQVQRYRSEQFELPNSQILGVLIDDDQADPKVVYLHWSEM